MKRLVFVFALVGAACGPDPVLSALSRADALYTRAEARAARGDVLGALQALDEVAALRLPAGEPEAEDVRVDALAEGSRILLATGQARGAEVWARRAVAAAGERPSYFAGLAWLRLGDALRAGGREREAVDAFERSIAVNRAALEGAR